MTFDNIFTLIGDIICVGIVVKTIWDFLQPYPDPDANPFEYMDEESLQEVLMDVDRTFKTFLRGLSPIMGRAWDIHAAGQPIYFTNEEMAELEDQRWLMEYCLSIGFLNEDDEVVIVEMYMEKLEYFANRRDHMFTLDEIRGLIRSSTRALYIINQYRERTEDIETFL